MQYNYFNHWVPSGNKRGKDKLSIEEAKRRFEDNNQTGNTFYILVGDEKNPDYLINYVCKDLISVYKLNNNLDDFVQISYVILYNIDNTKLYLNYLRFREYRDTNALVNNLLVWAHIEDYNGGNHVWKILENQRYEIFDIATNTEQKFEIDFPVKGNQQWREYPEFGEWDWMIEDLEFLLSKYQEMKNE